MKKISLILAMVSAITITEQSQAFDGNGAGGAIQYLCLDQSNGSEIFSGSAHHTAVPRLTSVCESRGGRLLFGFPL